jgi:hypothetical protein
MSELSRRDFLDASAVVVATCVGAQPAWQRKTGMEHSLGTSLCGRSDTQRDEIEVALLDGSVHPLYNQRDSLPDIRQSLSRAIPCIC